MPAYRIEPTDVLFFRDGIPMSAGQGRGAGCRLPFPSTLHEAVRASLFAKHGRSDQQAAFRPNDAPRKGGWLGKAKSVISGGSKDYQSLRLTGPLPWTHSHGLLLPVPLDVAFSADRQMLHRLQPAPRGSGHTTAASFQPPCTPLATTPPDKHGQLHGWWSVSQYLSYISGEESNSGERFKSVPTDDLWEPEYRVGVAIDPERSAAAEGALFAGTYVRAQEHTRFVFQAELGDAKAVAHGEGAALEALDWLLLGGDRRLARLWAQKEDPFAALRSVPSPKEGDAPVLLKWVLITPAIFAHGSLPGWCRDTNKGRPGGMWPDGRVCFGLPGKAAVISWCLGKPQTVTGWDIMAHQAKPTQVAVPAGSVYYFLCENAATAAALAVKLHWQPRSDHYGEKGCGYGLCSFHVRTSPDIRQLAGELFTA